VQDTKKTKRLHKKIKKEALKSNYSIKITRKQKV